MTGTALGYTVTQKVHVNPTDIKKITPQEKYVNETTGKTDYRDIEKLTVESGEKPKNIYIEVLKCQK